jgi:hypothetical protein
MRLRVFVFALMVFLLSACQVKDEYVLPDRDPFPKITQVPATSTSTNEPTIVPTATETPFPIIPRDPTAMPLYDFEDGINPLTGLPVEDPSILLRRPVIVKVSNWPRIGRPHAGLSAADVVFEYFIGYQMNRFAAIYYGQDSNSIGPVSSGRLVDAKLTKMYQGYLVYGNADQAVDKVIVDTLGERALAFGFVPCPALCGETTHSATGVYANSSEITKYVNTFEKENVKPDLRGMFFEEKLDQWDDIGEMLSFLYADFSVMQWHYNQNSGKYDLWQDYEDDQGRITLSPTTDRNNDLPLSFSNILIMFATYTQYSPSLHDIELNVSANTRSAILFRDGKVIYGSWEGPYQDYPLIFRSKQGELLPLKPGNSWIVIAGNHTTTERVNVGEWDFIFGLP